MTTLLAEDNKYDYPGYKLVPKSLKSTPKMNGHVSPCRTTLTGPWHDTVRRYLFGTKVSSLRLGQRLYNPNRLQRPVPVVRHLPPLRLRISQRSSLHRVHVGPLRSQDAAPSLGASPVHPIQTKKGGEAGDLDTVSTFSGICAKTSCRLGTVLPIRWW